ncbi:MAG: hypothetical protein QM426_10455 [Euryarchaeota archaeon]|nr:hypothetical protein [Euryarchaeota archaeon]
MKSKTLASILLTMLKRGADVSFYSSLDGGMCFLSYTQGTVFTTYIYPTQNEISTGAYYWIANIFEWAPLRKKDIEHFLKTGAI